MLPASVFPARRNPVVGLDPGIRARCRSAAARRARGISPARRRGAPRPNRDLPSPSKRLRRCWRCCASSPSPKSRRRRTVLLLLHLRLHLQRQPSPPAMLPRPAEPDKTAAQTPGEPAPPEAANDRNRFLGGPVAERIAAGAADSPAPAPARRPRSPPSSRSCRRPRQRPRHPNRRSRRLRPTPISPRPRSPLGRPPVTIEAKP